MSDSDETVTVAPTPLRVVQVEAVVFDFAGASPVVVLREVEGTRRALHLPVALPDATSIFQAWKRTTGRRPATSELVTFIMQEVHADVIAARIVKFEAGVYYAELDLMTPRGRKVFDCRPSDAITLTLRQAAIAPLLVAEDVLEQN